MIDIKKGLGNFADVSKGVIIICFDNTNVDHETIDIPILELIFDHKIMVWEKVGDVACSYFEFEWRLFYLKNILPPLFQSSTNDHERNELSYQKIGILLTATKNYRMFIAATKFISYSIAWCVTSEKEW